MPRQRRRRIARDRPLDGERKLARQLKLVLPARIDRPVHDIALAGQAAAARMEERRNDFIDGNREGLPPAGETAIPMFSSQRTGVSTP